MLLTKLLVLLLLLLQLSVFIAVEAVYENGSHSVWTNITHERAHQEVENGETLEFPHGVHVASIKFHYVKHPFIISVFLIFVALCKVGFHHAGFLSSWMPESCVLIVLGVVAGGIFKAVKLDMSDLNYIEPSPFFLVLLPPCILEAAYGLYDKVFFDNIGTVLIYAVIGTLINFVIIGVVLYALAICGAMGPIDIHAFDCLVFASLIVAVDPVAVLAIFQEVGVNSVLYFLVFGESLLNDAVTVVLYNTICILAEMPGTIPANQYVLACVSFFVVSLGGCAVGFIYGVISALITKVTSHVRVVEPLVILVLAYASYLSAELFHFSGIISIICCGLVQCQYAFHNISNNSSITVKYFVRMAGCTSESMIFLFLGLALIRHDHVWHTGFILWSVLLCLLARFFGTYFLTFLANYTYRRRIVGSREQFIMAYGGLRGAVAFCLVTLLDGNIIKFKGLFVTTTLIVIMFTVFIQGITVKPLVNLLKVEKDKEKMMSLCQEITDHVFDHVLVFIEDLIGNYGHNKFQLWMNNLDDKVFKRFLLKDPFTKDEVIMEVYQQMMMQQQYEELYGETNSSSQIQLYKRVTIEEEETSLEKKVLRQTMHAQAEILRRTMNIQSEAMRRTIAKQTAAKPSKFPQSNAEIMLPITDPKARRQSVKKERDELNKILKTGPNNNAEVVSLNSEKHQQKKLKTTEGRPVSGKVANKGTKSQPSKKARSKSPHKTSPRKSPQRAAVPKIDSHPKRDASGKATPRRGGRSVGSVPRSEFHQMEPAEERRLTETLPTITEEQTSENLQNIVDEQPLVQLPQPLPETRVQEPNTRAEFIASSQRTKLQPLNLRKILIKPRDVYAQNNGRNIKGRNNDDLLDLLQEKQNRLSRAVRASTMKAQKK